MPLTRLFHGRQQAVRQEFYLAYTMLMGKFQYRTEPWNWAYWDERRIGTADYDQWCAQGRRLGQEASERDLPLSTVYWSWIGRDCMEHPLLTARMAGTRCLSMNLLFANSASPAKFRVGPIPGLWVYSLTHAVVNALLLGVLIAAALTLRQVRQSPMLLVLALPYVARLAFSSLTYGEPRYLFAAQPGLAILAAVTLTPAVRMVLRRLSLVPRAWRHAWAGRS